MFWCLINGTMGYRTMHYKNHERLCTHLLYFNLFPKDRFYTGQNLYQFSENLVREGSNWEQAIMAWYDEVARFNPRSVDYFE